MYKVIIELFFKLVNVFIVSELRKCSSLGGDDKMSLVMNKVHELGKQYGVSSRCFPVSKWFKLLLCLQKLIDVLYGCNKCIF